MWFIRVYMQFEVAKFISKTMAVPLKYLYFLVGRHSLDETTLCFSEGNG